MNLLDFISLSELLEVKVGIYYGIVPQIRGAKQSCTWVLPFSIEKI